MARMTETLTEHSFSAIAAQFFAVEKDIAEAETYLTSENIPDMVRKNTVESLSKLTASRVLLRSKLEKIVEHALSKLSTPEFIGVLQAMNPATVADGFNSAKNEVREKVKQSSKIKQAAMFRELLANTQDGKIILPDGSTLKIGGK